MSGGFGFQELLLVAVIALLVFGPDRLPDLARQAGRLVARVRTETRRNVDELSRVAEVRELRAELEGVRRELRGTRADVTERLGAATGRSASRLLRDDDDPPPVDPEAT